MNFPRAQADEIILLALREDIGPGDITTLATVSPAARADAWLLAKEDLVLAGLPGFVRVFELLGGCFEWTLNYSDGDFVPKGSEILSVCGPAQALLTGERTALNLLQHLSGVATKTSRWAKRLEGAKAKLVDTRKTTLGQRALEKYAVKAGGGGNHRFGLFDGVLIKENHIRAAGGIAAAVAGAKGNIPHTVKIEVEVTDFAELMEAINSGADIVMLDNMSEAQMAEAVKLASGRVILEASGNVTEERLAGIAATGVDLISAGSLTHSARAVDISFLIK